MSFKKQVQNHIFQYKFRNYICIIYTTFIPPTNNKDVFVKENLSIEEYLIKVLINETIYLTLKIMGES